jgi:hypothetical protein
MQEEEEAPAFVIKKRTKPRSSLVSKLSTSSDATSTSAPTSSALEKDEEEDGNVPVIRSRGKKTPAGRVKARESGAAAARGRISFGGDDDGDEAGVSRPLASTRREEEEERQLMSTCSRRARAGRFGNQFRRQEVLERFFQHPAPLVAPVCFQYRFPQSSFVIHSGGALGVRLARKDRILRRCCRRHQEHLLERVPRRTETEPTESAQTGERGGDGRSIAGGIRLVDPKQVWGRTTPR